MKYRIDQLQVSGAAGCVTATVLARDLFNNGKGKLVLSIGEGTAVINAAQANELAEFLTAFDPRSEVNG